MATDPKTLASGDLPDMSDIGNQVTSNLASADSIAAQRVQSLMWVHQARGAQLSRTAASLKAQYGADDPAVKSSESAAAAANATAARVAVVHQQVTTAEPQVAPNGWALHGRVYDAGLAPVSAYTVFLVDASKAYQQSYGFAFTDDTGYFLLNYPGSDMATKPPSAAGAPQAGGASDLFVEIADRKGQPVFLSTTAFLRVVGSATYQNIVLPAGKQSIGEPPPEIRQVAQPKPKKSR